ncbi:alpha/beta hydrolase [Billgrantia saliphila]|uniref:alpha/beta hydrolase n=1 Tax=Billgrantia saliphila TaxID=1848458 RepID=UPI001E4B3559|nr:alpha/beta hydrolase [Halomonas saliphila]
MLYRDFATQEEIDREYDPMRGRDPAALLADWRRRSERVCETTRVSFDIAYGPTLAERLDLYHAGNEGAPLHVFFHGGYWRSLGHREFGFVAEGLVRTGINVAVVNYALCPTVAFGEVVRQSRAAVAWLKCHGESLGVDSGGMSVSGHSAGGHLCAMLLATDWQGGFGLPDDLIGGPCASVVSTTCAPSPGRGCSPSCSSPGATSTTTARSSCPAGYPRRCIWSRVGRSLRSSHARCRPTPSISRLMA